MVDRVRIDKWLWAARFFKTRGMANEAISKNQIRIGGAYQAFARCACRRCDTD